MESLPLPARANLNPRTSVVAAERLSLKLALSCMANLSWIGLSPEMAEEALLPPLLAKCLVDCVAADVSLRPYALPAAYNMSSEHSVLAALEAVSAEPLLARLASESEGVMTKYAKHARKNLKKHRKAVTLAARPQKEPKARVLGRRASKAKRGERSDAENAPPQQGATLVAGSNDTSPSKEPAPKRKGFRGARFASKLGSVGLRGRRASKANQSASLVAVLAAQGELAVLVAGHQSRASRAAVACRTTPCRQL